MPLTATDPDGDTLTWSVTTPAAHGSTNVTGSTLSYTPSLNYNGTDTVGVTVSDGRGGTASTTVTITVTPVNDPPVATGVAASTPEDQAKDVTLTATDPDGDSLTWSISTPASHGAATVSGSTLTYTPTANFNGSDQVGVTVSDGHGGSSNATVTLTVAPVNDAPTASDVTDATERNTSKQIALVGSDVDGDALTFEVVVQPAHGAVTIAGATATYTPETGYVGTDSFTYRSKDPSGATSGPATVSVSVTSTPQAPVATAVTATTDEDTAVTFTLTASDPNGDALTYSIATQPAHGSVTRAGNQATYTPAADYHGTDSFTWSVTDGTSSVTTSATITVKPVNDPPVASSGTLTTAEGTASSVGLVATDADGDQLTYAVGTQPAHGSVSLSGSTLTYTPAAGYAGPDSFTFTASDAVSTSAPATVTVTVTAVNHPPTLSVDQLHTIAGTPVSTTVAVSDPDGDTVTITGVSTPDHGSVTWSGLTITYTPATRSGTETFEVTVADGHGGTATAEVSVEISPRTTQLLLATPSATRGTPVTTTVTAFGPSGPKPTGTVTLTAGGAAVGTAALGSDGKALVTWTPTTAGTTELVASYPGDDVFAPATSDPSTPTVAKSASRLTLSAGTLRRGRAGTIKVTVKTVAGAAATGKVTLTVGAKKLTATLGKGVATFRIAKLPRTPRLKVSARYVGDSQYTAGSGVKTFTLRK